MKAFTKLLGGVAAAVALALPAQAVPISLFDLLEPQGQTTSITAGDKLFDSFAVTYYASTEDLRSLNASNILIDANNTDPMNPGLDFSVLGGELAVSGGTNFLDFTLAFRVSVLNPAMAINGASVSISSGAISNPGGIESAGMYIREGLGADLDDAVAESLGFMEVELADPASGFGILSTDSTSFAAQSELWVSKNFLIFADGDGDTASLQGFSQRFSQVTIDVPEPGSLALVALALTGLGVARRRRG